MNNKTNTNSNSKTTINSKTKTKSKMSAKKRLSILLIIAAVIFYFYATYWIGTGLSTNPTVGLIDFSVSENGRELTLYIGTPNSVGYIRDMSPMDLDTVQYIDFYCTFGGVNSSLGAKNEFVLEVDDKCQGIYFQREDGYELVLYLDPETNMWVKPVTNAE